MSSIKKAALCKDEKAYTDLLQYDPSTLYMVPEEDPDATPVAGSQNLVTSGGVFNAVNLVSTKLDEHESTFSGKITDLYARTSGLGGYLQAYNFGTATPTQTQLTEYALQQIPNATTQTQIFNQTRVVNLYDGVIWILTNTPDSTPAVFEWVSKGTESVGDANNDGIHGLVTGSNEQYRGHIEPNGSISVNGLDQKMNELDLHVQKVDSYIQTNNTNVQSLGLNVAELQSKDETIEQHLETFESSTNKFIEAVKGEVKVRIFKNVSASFVADTTYSAFPARAFIPIENFGNFSSAIVVLSQSQEYDNYLRAHGDTSKAMILTSPSTTNGGIYLFRTSTATITIPTIIVMSVPAVGVNFNGYTKSQTYTIKDANGTNMSSGTLNRLVYLPAGEYTLTVAETATTYPMTRKFTVGDTAFNSPIVEEINPIDMTPGTNIVPTTGDDSSIKTDGMSVYYKISYDGKVTPTSDSFEADFYYPGTHRTLQLNRVLANYDVFSYSVRLNKRHGNVYNGTGQAIYRQDSFFKIFVANNNTDPDAKYNPSEYGFRSSGVIMDTASVSPGVTKINGSPFGSIVNAQIDLNEGPNGLIPLEYDIRVARRGTKYYIFGKYSTDAYYVLCNNVEILNPNQKIGVVVSGNQKDANGNLIIFDCSILRASLENKGLEYVDELIAEGKRHGNYTKVTRLPRNIFGNYNNIITGECGVTTGINTYRSNSIIEMSADVKSYADTTETITSKNYPFIGFCLTDIENGNILYLGVQDATHRYSTSLSTGNGWMTRTYPAESIEFDPETGERIFTTNPPSTYLDLQMRNKLNPANFKLKVVIDGDIWSLYTDNGTGTMGTQPQLTINTKLLYKNTTTAGGYTWTETEPLMPGDKVALGLYSFGNGSPVAEFTNVQFNVTPKS